MHMLELCLLWDKTIPGVDFWGELKVTETESVSPSGLQAPLHIASEWFCYLW